MHCKGTDNSNSMLVLSLPKNSNRVRISVPNCELVDLVMWVMMVEMRGQNMIKFVIMRGVNLTPTSHRLVGEINQTCTDSCIR